MTGETSSGNRHLAEVSRYYHRRESRLGYDLLLGGTKHFGYYRPGDSTLPFGPPLLSAPAGASESRSNAAAAATARAGQLSLMRATLLFE